VAVAQLQHEPLLREEQTVVEQVFSIELRDPRRLVDDRRHDQPLHVVRVEVVALGRVRIDEHAGHQRVVGHVPVALPEGRERFEHVPLVPDRLDDTLDPPAAVLVDLVRFPAFGGAAEGVTDRSPRKGRGGAVGQQVFRHSHHSLIR
jgi:hypothetical protein